MKRLTERGEDGKYFVRISRDSDLILGAEERLSPGLEKWTGWWEHTVLGNIVDRLAAYEDTGLTPEEVRVIRWIPVEERLPEEGKRCLLYTPCDGILCVGYYAGKDAWQHRHKWRLVTAMRSTQTLTKKVTHWRPLPEAPKEVTHEK